MSREPSNPPNKPPGHDVNGVNHGRRRLLQGIGAGAGGAALMAAGVTPAQAGTENMEDRRRSLYRETDHVKRFYALNRL